MFDEQSEHAKSGVFFLRRRPPEFDLPVGSEDDEASELVAVRVLLVVLFGLGSFQCGWLKNRAIRYRGLPLPQDGESALAGRRRQ